MRVKRLLAAFLLGVGLCFVPVLGYGEVILETRITVGEFLVYKDEPLWGKVEAIDTEIGLLKMYIILLEAKVSYVMHNPTRFSIVEFHYDPDGRYKRAMEFPENVDTKGKIFVGVGDTRGVFSYKSGIALLDEFKRRLEIIYSFIDLVATDMDTDIVAKFHSREGIPLGYFYQGKYYLWEK
ncbi:hypothetical protein ES703_119263 [subsurface metagenome]